MKFWEDLSDDELEIRLRNLMPQKSDDYIELLVKNRDEPTVYGVIDSTMGEE